MKKTGIPVGGVKLSEGKLLRIERKPRNVSEAIARKKSNRKKVVSKGKIAHFNSIGRK